MAEPQKRTIKSPLQDLDRFLFAHLPTPLERLDGLRSALLQQGLKDSEVPQLWIKRDDCTGLAGGGNKARKLEFSIGHALARGADWIVTMGGIQSNHARQSAAAARRAGVKCALILQKNVARTEHDYLQTGNRLIDNLFADRIVEIGLDTDRNTIAEQVFEELSAAGHTPYMIPLGASNGIGGLGYVNAAQEILEQCATRQFHPDAIVMASSSGGTQAGLIAGMRIMNASNTRIVGVDVDSNPYELQNAVMDSIRDVYHQLGRRQADENVVEVQLGQGGPGYGLPTVEMCEAIQLMAREEGILLDPVYTGKALAALVSDIRNKTYSDEQHVIFLHTGGTFGLFAYQSLFENIATPIQKVPS